VHRIWALTLLALLPAVAAAQQASVSYVVDRWAVEDGLPQNSVLDVTQTPDRYLWLATRDGLARFDGASFTVYNKTNTPALPSNRITTLHVGPDSTLWIGTAQGLVRHEAGRFDFMGDDNPSVGTFIRQIASGPSGRLWVAPDKRLVFYKDGVFERYSTRFPSLDVSLVKHLYEDSKGRLWILYDHAAAMLHDGTLRRFSHEDGIPKSELETMVETEAGVAAGTHSGQLVRYRDGRFEVSAPLSSLSGTARDYLFEDTGQLWVATNRASINAYRDGDQVFQLDREDGRANPINDLFLDRAGNLWAGTEGNGLLRLRRPLFTVFDNQDGLSYNVTLSLSQAPDSSFWVGTNCQGLNRLKDGRFTPFIRSAVPANACLYAVLAQRDGTIWVGHKDLVRIRDGRATRYELPYDTLSTRKRGDVVKALYADPIRPGVLWVGTVYGLFRFEDGRLTRHYTPADGLPSRRVKYILRTRRDSTLWLSTGAGLSRLEDGQFTTFTTADGFPSSTPRALYEDREGTLWIGTYGDGLVRYQDSTFTAVTKADGLYDNVVSAIVPDDRGNVWMSGNRGIFRVRWESLDAFVEGRRATVPSVGYGTAAGLKNPETNGGFQPAAETDRRGRIWFPTLQGVAVVDPARVQAAAPPAVHVKQVRYQDESVSLSGPTNRLPKGRRGFAVTYTGINLSRPDAVRFQYRLVGFESEWQPAGARRTAFYTNVPPGAYTFQVRAANAGGGWSAPARMRVTVPPYFYETTWFALLAGLLGVGLLVGGYGARVYTLRRRREQLRRQVAARTTELRAEKQRAADALHTVAEQKDAIAELNASQSELFANVSHEFRTPLTVSLGLLEEWVEAPSDAVSEGVRRDLRQVLLNNRRLLRLVNQLLDIARLESNTLDLQVQWVDGGRLVERVALAFVALAERHDIAFRRDLPDDEAQVAADPDQLETVVVNLLSNAFKYTPPGGQVTLTLAVEEEALCLRVADTGPGIPEAEVDAIFDRFHQSDTGQGTGTGIGLSLTKALVERHGGTIQVETTVGKGSTFTVCLPWGTAHLDDRPDVTWRDTPARPTAGPDESMVAAMLGEGDQRDLGERDSHNEAPGEEGADQDRPTVLVVDDNADIRSYVRRHLTPTYRVAEASNGAEGLEQAREWIPDCIVADVMMPRMDGAEMLRTLRADPATDFLPVIFLTAKAAMPDKLAGLDAGADDYLTKPFRPDELKTRIRNLIAQRMRLRERFQREGGTASAPSTEEETTSPFLKAVTAAIHEHLGDDDLTVSRLAEEVGASRSKLYRKLGEATEVSPGDLIWQVRLDEARRLLREGAGNVSEVAYGVGFKSVSHFTNRFRDRFDESPSAVAASEAA